MRVKGLTIPCMLKEYLAAIKDIIFPRLCLYCQRKIARGYLCPDCREKITYLKPPLCRYCAKPAGQNAGEICRVCAQKTHPYTRALSVTAYKEPLVSLIHLFKYKNHDYLAELLGFLMAKRLAKTGFSINDYHYITPVPMHRHKLKERGYNQAELLARELSNYFKIPVVNDIIFAAYLTSSQTKLKGKERRENKAGVFIVKEDVSNKNIVVVDDIFTTGATAYSCCQALKKKGADKITVLTLAKTI